MEKNVLIKTGPSDLNELFNLIFVYAMYFFYVLFVYYVLKQVSVGINCE